MKNKLLKILSILGPGWIVMIADVDAPSVFTALVSGSKYALGLTWLLIFLIIPLYFVQESAARLGIVTKKGFGLLIKENFGKHLSLLSIGSMVIINLIAFVGEFAGIGAAGLIFGVPIPIAILLAAIFHTFIVMRGSYKKVENVLLYITLILFTFFISALINRPSPEALATIISSPQFLNLGYITLVLANIGAVIMPWMIFYHESAVVDRKMEIKELKNERKESLMGAIISEALMVAIMVTSASMFYGKLNGDVGILDLSKVFSAYAGSYSPYLFGIGILGAGILSGVVISLSSAWSLADYFNLPQSLNYKFLQAKIFYTFYFLEIVPSALFTVFFPDLVNLMIDAMVLNTVLLPIPMYFLIKLSSSEKLLGKYRNSKTTNLVLWATWILIIISIFVTVYTII